MFTFADKDGDGKISYTEFQIMINPPKPPEPPKPTLADLVHKGNWGERKTNGNSKVKDNSPQEGKKSPDSVIVVGANPPEPQTLSIANIMIHNANTKNDSLKGPKKLVEQEEKGCKSKKK